MLEIVGTVGALVIIGAALIYRKVKSKKAVAVVEEKVAPKPKLKPRKIKKSRKKKKRRNPIQRKIK